jgi:hypothetical protein
MGKKWVLWIALFSLTACGGESGPVGDPSGAGGPDAAPSQTEPDAATGASVTGLLLSPLPSLTRAAGVRMSIEDHPEIAPVLTDADGWFNFAEIPPNSDLIVRGEKDGHFSVVSRVFNSGNRENVVDIMFMLETTTIALLAQISAVEPRPGTGVVLGMVTNRADGSSRPGVRVAISPDTGVIRYASENGFVDPQLTETTSHGAFTVWLLDPGDYTMSAGSDTTTSCRATGLDNVASPTVRIYSETISHASFACE